VSGNSELNMKLTLPTKILIPRFDTHGDIVLLKGFIDALLERFPKAEITLFVREGYDQLKPLFSDRLVWRTQPYSPWVRYSHDELKCVVDALRPVASESWDLVLFTAFSRTFLEEILAAMLAEPFCVGLGKQPALTCLQKLALVRLNLPVVNPYDQIIPVEELSHETDKYQQFWELLFEQQQVLSLPEITVPEDLAKAAELVLAELELSPGPYVACMPSGTQNHKIKKWPEERFAELIGWFSIEHGVPSLLIGHESEQEILEEVKALAEARGVHVKFWIGKQGDLGAMAAILQKAALYIGNDSAPMHIAAAVGIPTVGIFGGGTWPRFKPVGKQTLAIVAKLPCFYCMWNCVLEEPKCIRLITVNDVNSAIDMVISDVIPENRIHEVHADPEELNKICLELKKMETSGSLSLVALLNKLLDAMRRLIISVRETSHP
jgi:ADP-heptose:LPS heptosyltransferase